MQIDTSELDAFASELEAAADVTLDAAELVMDDSMERIQMGAQALIRGQVRGVFLPHYASSITNETAREAGAVVGEVGPEIGRSQGRMGRGVEFGSVHTGPRPHMLPAGEDEEPALERRLIDVGIGVLS